MGIYALGDLHLSHASSKPMDVFGPNWAGHEQRIQAAWTAMVAPQDIVLLPGDISWAMHMEEAAPDLAFIAGLPGRKVLLRGNHDYWWSSLSKVRSRLQPGMYALQNDAMELDGALYAGSRGWTLPPYAQDADDQRIYARERMRLEMSLKAARANDGSAPLIAMMHYPPLTEALAGFSDILVIE